MIELVRKRRSIRSYSGEPIERSTLDLLVETVLRAPSSRNINPCEFIVVDDAGLLQQLSTAKHHGSNFLKGAAAGIVVCADETKSDVWVEDCSIAAILVQMVAQPLGLGSCWIQIRKRPHGPGTSAEAYVQGLLGLPGHLRVACIISLGHPAEKRRPLAASQLQYGKVAHNRYGQPWRLPIT